MTIFFFYSLLTINYSLSFPGSEKTHMEELRATGREISGVSMASVTLQGPP